MLPSRLRASVQAVAVAIVAVPAIGIALLVVREGVQESGDVSVNRLFHITLGVALLILFADFLVAIRRSESVRTTLALGAGGFVACLIGAILSELFGPPALVVLLVGAAAWAVVLVRTGRRARDLRFEVTGVPEGD